MILGYPGSDTVFRVFGASDSACVLTLRAL